MALFESNPAGDILNYYSTGMKQVAFSPYDNNGGSVVAVGGDGYCIIAGDTRLSSGRTVLTREQKKLFQLSKNTVLGCAGCWCDTLSLTRMLAARMQMYKHEHQKDMSTSAAAQMVSTVLYYKRFFPYYIGNLLAGLDEDGKGCVYSYDPVGHCEKRTYGSSGSGGVLLQPLLDSQIALKNQEGVEEKTISLERALSVIKDAFISTTERDTTTGDGITIMIITKDGIKEEYFSLRKD